MFIVEFVFQIVFEWLSRRFFGNDGKRRKRLTKWEVASAERASGVPAQMQRTTNLLECI